MGDTPSGSGGTAGSQTSTTAAQQQQNLELRTSLSDAYAAVEGDKTTQSFNAITFDHASAAASWPARTSVWSASASAR